MSDASQKQLLGFWMCLATVIGSIIGVGIFTLPVSLAPLGQNAIIGWIVSVTGALCLAYALAQLTKGGGDGIYFHIERAFGPAVAFLVSWAFWCSIWSSFAALAMTAGASIARVLPGLFGESSVAQLAIVSIIVVTLINAFGIKSAGRFNVLTVAIRVLPLVVVIAIVAGRTASAAPVQAEAPMPVTVGNIALAATLTLFALTGFENMTTPVNKVRDPARTIPRSIIIGTLLVAILYLFSSTSVTLLLPADQVAGSTAPYADAIATKWGSAAAAFAALCIAVSAIGCMNAGVLACGELGLAMSLGGDLPKWLSTTTAAGTPVASQLLGSLLGVVMVMLNSSRGFAGLFTFIILLATASTLLLYFVGALAALKKPQTSLGRIVIGIGLLFALFAFWGAGAEALAWNLVLLLIGFALRFVIRFSSRGSTPAPAPAPAVPREPSA